MADQRLQPTPEPSTGTSPIVVQVGSGSLRLKAGIRIPHAWTEVGMVTDALGTGAHTLHLAVAVCVLNDFYREAGRLGYAVAGVLVTAEGGFDEDLASTGISYAVQLDGLDEGRASELVAAVDEVAEIPRALRAGIEVRRVAVP